MRVEGLKSAAASEEQTGIRHSVGDAAKSLQPPLHHRERREFPEGAAASAKPDITRTPLAELLKESEYDLSFYLSFCVHKETQRLVVKVIDPDTNKVIREIPPEELLDLAVRLQEMIGLLFDKRI
ncbi:MAG: flagellar protein FlaG [Clostridia bacterium]|jgi:flagellar protein FlaG|nr:flagellar protein FlaG [Clostridia bacterium]